MDSKVELHQFIEKMNEEQAAYALTLLKKLFQHYLDKNKL